MFHPNRRLEIIEKALREGVEVDADNRTVSGALFAAVAYESQCGDPGPGCCLPQHLGDFELSHEVIGQCETEDGKKNTVGWLFTEFEDDCIRRRWVDGCSGELGPEQWLFCVHEPKEIADEKS